MTQEGKAVAAIKSVMLYAAISIAAIVVLFPFAWMILTAFKVPGTEFNSEILPHPPTLENFKRVFTEFGFMKYFLNSTIVAVSAALFATFFGSLAAYAFSFKNFILKEKIFAIII
ncbi:MAG: carbohydrate ABC transporter permease, partial [bacterium]